MVCNSDHVFEPYGEVLLNGASPCIFTCHNHISNESCFDFSTACWSVKHVGSFANLGKRKEHLTTVERRHTTRRKRWTGRKPWMPAPARMTTTWHHQTRVYTTLISKLYMSYVLSHITVVSTWHDPRVYHKFLLMGTQPSFSLNLHNTPASMPWGGTQVEDCVIDGDGERENCCDWRISSYR